MTRVRLVMRPSVINQPVPIVAEIVNARLDQLGLTRVSERTIRRDIDRALDMYRERIVGGVEWYRAQFQAQLAETLLDLEAVPRGKDRAPLRAVAIRLLEDMARLDGVWTQVAAEQPEAAAAWDLDVPNVQELVEAGEITQDQLGAYLLVLHRETGGIKTGPRNVTPASEDVIDGETTDLPGVVRRTGVATPRVSPNGSRGLAGVGPMGDELPDVVDDWIPDDEE